MDNFEVREYVAWLEERIAKDEAVLGLGNSIAARYTLNTIQSPAATKLAIARLRNRVKKDKAVLAALQEHLKRSEAATQGQAESEEQNGFERNET